MNRSPHHCVLVKFLISSILFMAATSFIYVAHTQEVTVVVATDSLSEQLQETEVTLAKKNKIIKKIILPVCLISYGFVAQNSKELKKFDVSIKNLIRKNHPHFHTKIDDYSQYSPAFFVYGLNAVGIKGKNGLTDRTMIYLISNAIMCVTVQSLKTITKVQRPDGYGTNAFPSGHTATAFTAAEFLYQEYKAVSPWYGVGGYFIATMTGVLRMYNNKHWFRDLFPGAGIGILSTKIAYWIYPTIKRKFFENKHLDLMVMPRFENGGGAISLIINLSK